MHITKTLLGTAFAVAMGSTAAFAPSAARWT